MVTIAQPGIVEDDTTNITPTRCSTKCLGCIVDELKSVDTGFGTAPATLLLFTAGIPLDFMNDSSLEHLQRRYIFIIGSSPLSVAAMSDGHGYQEVFQSMSSECLVMPLSVIVVNMWPWQPPLENKNKFPSTITKLHLCLGLSVNFGHSILLPKSPWFSSGYMLSKILGSTVDAIKQPPDLHQVLYQHHIFSNMNRIAGQRLMVVLIQECYIVDYCWALHDSVNERVVSLHFNTRSWNSSKYTFMFWYHVEFWKCGNDIFPSLSIIEINYSATVCWQQWLTVIESAVQMNTFQVRVKPLSSVTYHDMVVKGKMFMSPMCTTPTSKYSITSEYLAIFWECSVEAFMSLVMAYSMSNCMRRSSIGEIIFKCSWHWFKFIKNELSDIRELPAKVCQCALILFYTQILSSFLRMGILEVYQMSTTHCFVPLPWKLSAILVLCLYISSGCVASSHNVWFNGADSVVTKVQNVANIKYWQQRDMLQVVPSWVEQQFSSVPLYTIRVSKQLNTWGTGPLLPPVPCCHMNWSLILWDPGGAPYAFGMNATFPIYKYEVVAVVGPAYILLLLLLEELVTEHGNLITPLWFGDAEIFRNAIGPSGASCGIINTVSALIKSKYYIDGSQCERFRDVLRVIFPEVRYDEWYSTQSAISRFTVIHHFEQDASPSSRTVETVGKPLFMLHFYNLVIEDP